MTNYSGKRLKRTKPVDDQHVLDMLKREDYYKILKIRAHPEDALGIRWQVMRTKWSVLNQMDKL